MNENFINLYIENLNRRVEEFSKNEIILNTRLQMSEKIINDLVSEKTELEEKLKNFTETSVTSINKKK